VETPRVRRRLVLRGGDLSEKPPPRRRFVEEASHWLESRRLANEGLDRGLHSSLCWILVFILSMMSDDSTSRVIISPLKGL
jgi:hypothetical protein